MLLKKRDLLLGVGCLAVTLLGMVGRGIKKLRDRNFFLIFPVCLVGRMDKKVDENLFCLVEKKN